MKSLKKRVGTVLKLADLRHSPRIPARYRLVHKGTAHGHWLRPSSLLPFLVFEPVRQGLHGQLPRPRRDCLWRKQPAWFVLDARHLPGPAHWLHTAGKRGGRGGPGDLLCDLIDLCCELLEWRSALTASSAASTLQLPGFTTADPLMSSAGFHASRPHDRLVSLISTKVICEGRSGDPLRTRPAVLAMLHELQRRHAKAAEVTAPLSRAEFDSGEWAINHPFKSALLHALERRGTLDLDLPQLNQLYRELPYLWLRTFTRPAVTGVRPPFQRYGPAMLLAPGALRVLR